MVLSKCWLWFMPGLRLCWLTCPASLSSQLWLQKCGPKAQVPQMVREALCVNFRISHNWNLSLILNDTENTRMCEKKSLPFWNIIICSLLEYNLIHQTASLIQQTHSERHLITCIESSCHPNYFWNHLQIYSCHRSSKETVNLKWNRKADNWINDLLMMILNNSLTLDPHQNFNNLEWAECPKLPRCQPRACAGMMMLLVGLQAAVPGSKAFGTAGSGGNPSAFIPAQLWLL